MASRTSRQPPLVGALDVASNVSVGGRVTRGLGVPVIPPTSPVGVAVGAGVGVAVGAGVGVAVGAGVGVAVASGVGVAVGAGVGVAVGAGVGVGVGVASASPQLIEFVLDVETLVPSDSVAITPST